MNWENFRVATFSGATDTHKNTGKPYDTVSLRGLFERIRHPTAVEKDQALGVLASDYCASDAREPDPQKAHGKFVLLRVDFDNGNHPLADIQSAVQSFAGPDCDIAIYSTASATKDARKWRAMLALPRAMSYAAWHRLQVALRLHMKDRDIDVDSSMEKAAQFIYAPNVPPKSRGRDGLPLFYEQTETGGEPLDLSAPGVVAALALADAAIAAEQVARTEAKNRAAERRSSRGDTSGLIELWNDSHPLAGAFKEHGFVTRNRGRDWHHDKLQTSASYSWRIYPAESEGDRESWICFGQSAHVNGIGTESVSGKRYGDAFDLYVYFEHAGDVSAAIKAASKIVTVIDPETGEVLTLDDKTRATWLLTNVEQAAMKNPSQDVVASVFEQHHKGAFLYVHEFGHWMEWADTRWLKDPAKKPFDLVRNLSRWMTKKGTNETAKASFYEGVVTILRHTPAFSAIGSEFDADPYILNTPGGVINLRTGETSKHDPLQRLSRITAVPPSKDGGELFEKTLTEICDGDKSLKHFLQVALGACLSGAIEGHWLLYFYGTGRNGKSLLADLLFHVLGDYSHKLPSDVLMSKQNQQHPTSIAALAGRRFVVSSEVKSNAFFDTSLIKELTGDETITARFMKQDEFTFKRTHKHIILGNYRPQMHDADPAMMARLKMVPFNVNFEATGRIDRGLPDKLKQKAGYVLHWLIEGHRMWTESGFKLPDCAAVDSATVDYFSAQSTVKMWLDENCERLPDDGQSGRYWPKASDLYQDYSRWKRDRGEFPVSQTRFGEELPKLGIRKVSAAGVRYVGVRLKPYQPNPDVADLFSAYPSDLF